MKRFKVNIRVRETRTLEIEAKSIHEAKLIALEHPDYKHTTFDREISVKQVFDMQGNQVG